MHGTVAVTDFGWYEFLLAGAPEEVNFWTPSDRRRFFAPQFSPFFFKLKAPYNAICGFGYFATWSSLPDWLAWESFGAGNGATSLQELRERLGTIRRRIGYVAGDTAGNIGCILVVQPTFFERSEWVAQPRDWHPRIVTNKPYDLSAGEGLRIWEACLERAAAKRLARGEPVLLREQGAGYGTPRPFTPRLGQGTFRISVTDAYGRACAVTGEHSLPALEAGHIRAFAQDGPHEVRNGVLLRADLHRLFDRGYVTITPDYKLEVSSRLRTDFHNGRTYYPLNGAPLTVPTLLADQPAPDFLTWHNEQIYLG